MIPKIARRAAARLFPTRLLPVRLLPIRFAAVVLTAAALLLAAPVGAFAAQPDTPIDINSASVEELTELPRVGKATAAKIVAWREENGPFTSARELLNVEGIGEKTFEKIEPHVTVGGSGGPPPAPGDPEAA